MGAIKKALAFLWEYPLIGLGAAMAVYVLAQAAIDHPWIVGTVVVVGVLSVRKTLARWKAEDAQDAEDIKRMSEANAAFFAARREQNQAYIDAARSALDRNP